MDFYSQIFKRKSFHIFRNIGKLSEGDISKLNVFVNSVTPLDSSIRTEIRIVPESETTCKRGAEYCILFYCEKKGEYLRNIGYIGEQIDLYLASQNIGALWYGIGKPKEMQINGLDFVIMIAIAKMPANKVSYYNRIDIGIYLFMLETCLSHEGYTWRRTLYEDNADDSIEKVKVASYRYKK